MHQMSLDFPSVRKTYSDGSVTPSELVRELYPKLVDYPNAFIHLIPFEDLLARCQQLEGQAVSDRGQLWGLPFAVKDNVDVADIPTTAACPALKYVPSRSCPGVEALLAAGAIMVGKTNMDQLASGLVGTRSPYGCPPNSFDARFIPGGSSSGSGAVVGAGLVSFAIGTDTAGSGRVPAGYNGCVGIKPTLGALSKVGVVPACASLDCVTVMSHTVEDGVEVTCIMRRASAGADDIWRRPPAPASTPPGVGAPFRFAVPNPEFLEWDGAGGPVMAAQSSAAFQAAIQRLVSIGGQLCPLDFTPLVNIAKMLYESSFVAERYSGVRTLLDSRTGGRQLLPADALAQQRSLLDDHRLLPVIRAIVSGAGKFTAVDVFDDNVKLAALKAAALDAMAASGVQVLLVPTVLEHYLQEEIAEHEQAEPPSWPRNAKNGRFTNFVNLVDMCGISVPSGLLAVDYCGLEAPTGGGERRAALLESSGGPMHVALPFGVTLLAPAWWDDWLWGVAACFQEVTGLRCGPRGHGVVPVV